MDYVSFAVNLSGLSGTHSIAFVLKLMESSACRAARQQATSSPRPRQLRVRTWLTTVKADAFGVISDAQLDSIIGANWFNNVDDNPNN